VVELNMDSDVSHRGQGEAPAVFHFRGSPQQMKNTVDFMQKVLTEVMEAREKTKDLAAILAEKG
jgi:hypothetical protein